MPTPAGDVPILESVAAAWRGWRAGLPRAWPYAVGGALLLSGFAFAAQRAGANMGVGFLLDLAAMIVIAGVYAAQLHGPLGVAADARRRGADALRVLASMGVAAFFMFIVMLVALLPGSIVFGVAIGEEGGALIESVQGDPAATMAAAQQLASQHWPVLALLIGVYTFVWLALTSRLYLAAPASVAEERIRTFETWAWTKGNMLRIMAARVIALAPVWIVLQGLQALAMSALGANPLDPQSFAALIAREPLRYLSVIAPMHALTLLALYGLEAALSAYLYKGLKPQSA